MTVFDVDAALWARYWDGRGRADRDALIVAYVPLVRDVATRLARRLQLPPHVEVAELVSLGTFGLIDAIAKFDPAFGVPFESYAAGRIRGAVVDGLRSADWVPRSVRDLARRADRATSTLAGRLHRQPTDAEVARELGVPVDELTDALAAATATGVALAFQDDERLPVAGDIASDFFVDDLGGLVAPALATLPRPEQLLLALYYRDGRTIPELAELLELSVSRVSKLLTRSIDRLQAELMKDLR